MIFSKQPQRDNIEIMLARKCGFYIRGKQQGLAEDEISMPILMTQTLHEMLVHFADEVRTITKAVYDVEIEPLRVRATQAENIALEQQAEITSLREQLEIAKKDGWISVDTALPVGEIKISWGSDTGYEYGLTLIGGALGSQKEYDEWIVKNFNGEGIFKLYTSPRDQSAKIAELTAKVKELEEYIEIDCRQVIQNFQESDIKLTAKCEKMREALQETVKLIDKREIDYILTADDAILRETCNKLLEGV